MYRGLSGVNIDAKGRIVLPSRSREHLQANASGPCIVVLTIDTEERCLLLYPLLEWERIEAKLANLPSFNAAARRIQRLLMGHATDVEMDGQGRILLPPLLREYASLTKRVVLVGQGKKLEIWDEERWQASRERWLKDEASADIALLPEELKSIAL